MLRPPTNPRRRTSGACTPPAAVAGVSPTLSRPCVLVTGFDPFDGAALNPSWLAALALHGRSIGGHRVIAAQLPTVFDRSLLELAALLKQHRPALVLCLGQAGGRSAISLERVAININDARIADNVGAQPTDSPVVHGGPSAYFSTLPIKAIVQEVTSLGIAAQVSQTAGTFVCNHVFYTMMHALAQRTALAHTTAGFIHVPWLPEQGSPSMPLADMVRAIRQAIRCALERSEDLHASGGALH